MQVLSTGTVVDERYEIQSRLGAGAMSTVFRARDYRASNRLVALKVLHGDRALDQQAVQRFSNEVAVGKNLSHPNIVKTLDSVQHYRGACYFVMEYIEGGTLADYLKSLPYPLPVSKAISFLAQIASALAHSHSRNILHRDLKPQNILLSADSTVLKLSDFGLGRMLLDASRVTHSGETVGTPSYMAPELFVDGEHTPSSEIYAFGILMFELVEGYLPFQDSKLVTLALKHVKDPLPALRRRETPKALAQLIKRCTQKDPLKRPSSFDEIVDVFEELRGLKPSKPRPRSFFSWQQVLILTACLGILGFSVYSFRAELENSFAPLVTHE